MSFARKRPIGQAHGLRDIPLSPRTRDISAISAIGRFSALFGALKRDPALASAIPCQRWHGVAAHVSARGRVNVHAYVRRKYLGNHSINDHQTTEPGV